MKFHYYFATVLLFLLSTSSIILCNNERHKHKDTFTNHMTPTSTIKTAVLIPTTSTTSLSPTIDIRILYYASPSYNTSYGEPAPVLQTRNTWQDIIYGILFMLVGLIEVFFGYRLIRITLLIMGFLFWSSTSVVILLLIDNYFSETFRSALYYFVIWLSCGTLGGLLSYWCWRLGLILSSAYGGFAFIITLLTLVRISIDILRYFIISFFVLLPPIVVHKYERLSIILFTSIAGSYTFFYGIDEFAHQGYREMIQFTRFEGTKRFTPTVAVYIMIVFTMLLAAFGITFEYTCHAAPCYNSWCGDKTRNGKHSEGEENTCSSIIHHTGEVQQQQSINFISQKLYLIKINLLNLCIFIWVNLRDFGNLLLVKIINLFKNIKLGSSNFKNNGNISSNVPDMHVINIDN